MPVPWCIEHFWCIEHIEHILKKQTSTCIRFQQDHVSDHAVIVMQRRTVVEKHSTGVHWQVIQVYYGFVVLAAPDTHPNNFCILNTIYRSQLPR